MARLKSPSDYFGEPGPLAKRLSELMQEPTGRTLTTRGFPETAMRLYNGEWELVIKALRAYAKARKK